MKKTVPRWSLEPTLKKFLFLMICLTAYSKKRNSCFIFVKCDFSSWQNMLSSDLQIKRPYFHVKPLDRLQLRAWHSYLDWEIDQLNKDTTEPKQGVVFCRYWDSSQLRAYKKM